jgi:hypothetical protein
MDVWRLIADRKIREAMDEGAFDRLSGAGQPLPTEDLTYTDPTLWMAHHIMKNNSVVPAWVAEGNEIEAEIERLRRLGTPSAADIAALNRRIAGFNLAAPVAVHKMPRDPAKPDPLG